MRMEDPGRRAARARRRRRHAEVSLGGNAPRGQAAGKVVTSEDVLKALLGQRGG